MKKLLAILWLTVSFAYAQDQSTPNLITSGSTHTWTGVTTGADPGGCCAGGPGALYDPSTNTIHFSYGNATAAQTFAINQAFANSGAGVQITGYNYSWDIKNNAQNGADPLYVNVYTWNYNNTTVRRTDSWTYTENHDWRTYSGNVGYAWPGPVSDFGNLTVKFASVDRGYWAGYYGPKVRNVNIGMTYSADTCASDPLSSTNCAGYAQAWLNLQCSGNALYSPSCPGYAQAYFTQQCTVNALSDPSCPGYAQAYLTYQCSVNPLYATSCSGYEQAYFNQRCERDQLYSSLCPGYSVAYAKKMLLEQQGIASTVAAAGTVAAIKENDPTTQATAVVADQTVNSVVTSTATSVSSTTATVPLVSTSSGTSNVTTTSVSSNTVAATPPPETKPAAPTARQELAAKREAQAKKDAVEKGKNLANEMGKAQDMESQKQIQNVVIQAMGFTPGFDAYGKVLVPDANGYRPFTVYNKQSNVDNARLGRQMFGPTEQLHIDLINMQFK